MLLSNEYTVRFSSLKHWNLYSLVFIFLLLFNSCGNKKDPTLFSHPADFEPVESICFMWSGQYKEIISELIGAISGKGHVTVFFDEELYNEESVKMGLGNYNSNFSNIGFQKFQECPEDNVWIRDFGPVYLINGLGEKKLVEFKYFNERFGFTGEYAAKMNLPVIKSSLNSSGGAREVNGKGTILLCEAHELDVNHPKIKSEIEKEITENLVLKKVIWLKRGIPQDDSILEGPLYENIYPNGLNGHVDEFCRFANPETILISSVSEEEANTHAILREAKKRLDENYEILVNSTDQDGKKFKVVKVPFAPLRIVSRYVGQEKKHVTTVTSYMNFIITDSLIILPSYDLGYPRTTQTTRMKEKEVVGIFKEVFPAREVIKVKADRLNYFSGGFHCVSINIPRVNN